MPNKLTADTITDEQIRSVWTTCPNAINGRTLMVALCEPYPSGEYPSAAEIESARARCAEILNERNR